MKDSSIRNSTDKNSFLWSFVFCENRGLYDSKIPRIRIFYCLELRFLENRRFYDSKIPGIRIFLFGASFSREWRFFEDSRSGCSFVRASTLRISLQTVLLYTKVRVSVV